MDTLENYSIYWMTFSEEDDFHKFISIKVGKDGAEAIYGPIPKPLIDDTLKLILDAYKKSVKEVLERNNETL